MLPVDWIILTITTASFAVAVIVFVHNGTKGDEEGEL